MKKISLLIFLVTSWSYSQNLELISGESLAIMSGTVFYVNGLGLTPSADFTINGPNSISRSSTAIDALCISRVFVKENLISGFEGTLNFFYEDSELNGVEETNLVLIMKDDSNAWISYEASHDTELNILTHTFATATSFSTVTATSNESTLATDDLFSKNLNLYPNPASSRINISTDSAIEIDVFNLLGQKVLNTREKTVDVSYLKKGFYFFVIKDLLSNKIYTYKVLKE